jgi:hypothetical protein
MSISASIFNIRANNWYASRAYAGFPGQCGFNPETLPDPVDKFIELDPNPNRVKVGGVGLNSDPMACLGKLAIWFYSLVRRRVGVNEEKLKYSELFLRHSRSHYYYV